MKKHSASVVGPDPDGLYWITLEAGEIRASISVRGTGIVGQVMAAFTGQPALVSPPTAEPAHRMPRDGETVRSWASSLSAETVHGDVLLDSLQRSIDRAEHKPEQWAQTCQSMGGVCTKQDSPLSTEDRWGSFSHKRDAWLAVAAVNALPELMAIAREVKTPDSSLNQRARCWGGVVSLLNDLVPGWDDSEGPDSLFDEAIRAIRKLAADVVDLKQQLAGEREAAREGAIERFREQAEARLSQAATDVLAERRRQVEVEGYTAESDSGYQSPALAKAAGCYILFADAYPNAAEPPPQWPWCPSYWKPKDYRRDLVRGVALGLAEIERLDRNEAKASAEIHENWTEAEEARMDPIGQNGNDGAVYAELAELAIQQGGKPVDELPDGLTWEQAPEWADRLSEVGPLNTLVWHSDERYRYAINGTEHPVSMTGINGSGGTYSLSEMTFVATRPAPASGRDATQV